jgi:hypothetical protein
MQPYAHVVLQACSPVAAAVLAQLEALPVLLILKSTQEDIVALLLVCLKVLWVVHICAAHNSMRRLHKCLHTEEAYKQDAAVRLTSSVGEDTAKAGRMLIADKT